MAQLTKAQLLVDIEQLRVERQQLITQRDEAVEALHRLKDELLASKLPQARPIRVQDTIRGEATVSGKVFVEELGRFLPIGFAKAREAALRTGHAVKIGA